ncbi:MULTISPECIES: molybdopterin oxidoreductase family protein [Aminobacter]|uniref:Anaerobic selenocysteine-containing dehydrogenase n=2 Tax=Aminobacter TaxID=31988 RepID=A0AAC8YP82_AMIAI|nr:MULTISPECIES: molybdopterin oxidoreductase family protein [Aminobacter]AMS41988.1 formate dehydrogenase [Aminobacter aminovorans]MBA8904929.1 anaerobic selenocysteine-containing dehydrogenase [Aminobacter ciceronei]MBA9018517.1 anaerobic selenocysteine-containing dehydrogenase [Aminobacter ciceronei]MBB3706772.1 anaerobic selenocysteine-containing dehydrogenase [Aminobacter aminovorans]MRX31577.1 molybdopterin-dependent oxidoreductase [Aminobacter sp. MDW-2]
MKSEPHVALSEPVSDEVRKTTCYMCACRCGIDVHLKDGKVRYIEGNRDHPVNRGVLCAKGSAGIMQHYAPARLRAPLLRTGPRGSGEFKEISWDDALELATGWLDGVRHADPKKLAFFTGRDQSQSLTGFWAQQFGTPNYAAHGGFCSVNMAAAGIMTIGGAFWEFGAPDWDRTKLFVMFGVAEDHDSNPLKIGISKLKKRGARFVSVNPVRTGYSAVADNWIGIRPGTDGLLILAVIHELLKARKIDVDYIVRYSNATWLVVDAPGTAEHGLFVRDAEGKPQIFESVTEQVVALGSKGARAALSGRVELPDGRFAVPSFQLLAEKYLDPQYAPEAVAAETGVAADVIRGLAAEIARVAFDEAITIDQPWTDMNGERHEAFVGRPVSFHAMRGLSAHSNGFQTARALHMLQVLIGAVDCPGAFRFEPPYPKPIEAHPTPHGKAEHFGSNKPLSGPHLGFPRGPEDLLIDADGKPMRIDKAFSWDAPISAHGLMHMVIANAHAGDPYPIDLMFLYMANMAWNSSMNTAGVIRMLEDKDPATGAYRIPKIIYSDAYSSEMVAYADLVLPDTTYLERHDCISLLDRPISEPDAVQDAIRWPVVEPDRDVRGFQSVLIDLGARLKLPGFVDSRGKALYADYADYIVRHERRPGIGPLAGFRGSNGDRAGRGAINRNQLDRYIENGSFFSAHIPLEAQFFKHANKAYQDFAVRMGFFDEPKPVTFQLYQESLQKFRLSAEGLREPVAPETHRERILATFDPLPMWYRPFEEAAVSREDYPYHAITQRPAAMYHSWGSMNAWLRQIHTRNPLYVPGPICDEIGLVDGDWVWVISHHGRIKVEVARMEAVNSSTIWTWNAIGKRAGAWALDKDAPEAKKGFLMNHLIHELLPPKGDGMRWSNSDPVTGQAAWYDLRVRIEKAEPAEVSEPHLAAVAQPGGARPHADELRYGQEWAE